MQDIIYLLVQHYPEFLHGTWITINVSIVGLALGMLMGLPLAIMRIYGGKRLNKIAELYIGFFRGTPLLVQLFLIYYGLPEIGLTFNQMTAAYIAMGLNSAAYQAEYFRGAIVSIRHSQMMAARAIGMNKFKAILFIILPQAFRLVIPSWANEAIGMIRASSVLFLIALPDVMGVGKILSARYFTPLAAYTDVALIYIVIIFFLGFLFNKLEKRLRIPGLDVELK